MHKDLIGKSEFTFRPALSPEIKEQVYELRYQVYCEECGYIKEEHYTDSRETDKYDPYSLNFLAEDKLGIIGCVRLILDSSEGFPVEEHCADTLTIDKKTLPRKNLAEISRLVISKDYRRRKDDGLYYTPDFNEVRKEGSDTTSNPYKRIRSMTFGLYREIYQESKKRQITHWFALMPKALWMLLSLNGFIFENIGPPVEFFGLVRPYIGKVEDMEEYFYKKYPEFYKKYFLDGLEPEFWPKFLTDPSTK